MDENEKYKNLDGKMNVDLVEVVKSISKRAESNYGREKGDYVAEDGLLYCGKCNTPKQCIIHFGLGEKRQPLTVFVPCECRKEEEARMERKRKLEERAKKIFRLFENSGIAVRDRDKSFSDSDKSDQMAICKGYAQRFTQMAEEGQGLLLWGDPGTGKTHAALCIANALLLNCVSVLMVSVPEILRNDKQEWLYDRIQRVKLLILDDLGAERGTEYAAERVYDVVDTRYRAGLPMVCTSNLSIKEMQSTADIRQRRIYERILETCYPLHFTQARRQGIARERFKGMQDILSDSKSEP